MGCSIAARFFTSSLCVAFLGGVPPDLMESVLFDTWGIGSAAASLTSNAWALRVCVLLPDPLPQTPLAVRAELVLKSRSPERPCYC